jgi:rSAM/selenodomain-associated transferase 1
MILDGLSGRDMMKPTLLVFTKAPRIGVAKTRLAAGLGRSEARRIARFTLSRTIQAAFHPAWHTRLMITPEGDLDQSLGGLWPEKAERRVQAGGDLGQRLANAMRTAQPGPVFFIGTDAPDINARLIHEGVRALRRNDAVFGPARDGGFWLFGLRQCLRTSAVFDGIRWSSPHAMEDVCNRLPEKARVAFLPELYDIDTEEDWTLYKRQKKNPFLTDN